MELNLDFLDFAFLRAILKASSDCSMCRIAMVDSAFERSSPNVFDHVVNEWWRRLEISVRIEISMGFTKKLRISIFLIWQFCFHEATLEGDLAR